MHAQHIDFLDLLDGQVQYIVPRWQRRYRWGQADIERLDKAHAKYSDMVLVHGGGPGTDRIAAQRAERNGVHQIVCKPDWDRHGRAESFRRNDELLSLLSTGLIPFPGSGITDNLVEKSMKLGIPVARAA